MKIKPIMIRMYDDKVKENFISLMKEQNILALIILIMK
jgi:hypothetical protein